jgi:hypothetical protein
MARRQRMAPPMNSYQRPTVINLRMSNHLAMDASVGVTLGVASGAKNRARSLMHRRTMPGDGQVDPDRCRCQGMRQGPIKKAPPMLSQDNVPSSRPGPNLSQNMTSKRVRIPGRGT